MTSPREEFNKPRKPSVFSEVITAIVESRTPDIKVIRRLLDEGTPTESGGFNALVMSAQSGYTDVVRLLLDKGVDVNGKCGFLWGSTALIVARDIEIVRLLLERGADVNAKNDQGMTALMWAAAHGHKEVAALLLDNGADVRAKNNKGQDALGWAKLARHKDMVKLLEDAADPRNMKIICTLRPRPPKPPQP